MTITKYGNEVFSIKIAEISFTAGPHGEAVIPSDLLREMGIAPGETIYAAYIEDEAALNCFHEFLLSAQPLDELSQPTHIMVPDSLLEDANIPSDAEVQVICINSAIILCRESALESDELLEVLQSLDCAVELTEQLPPDADDALEVLHSFVEKTEGGKSL